MPDEGFADPIMNDKPGFHSNMPVSELTEHVTQANGTNDISATPSVAETSDGAAITKMNQPLIKPLLCTGAQGKLDSQGD